MRHRHPMCHAPCTMRHAPGPSDPQRTFYSVDSAPPPTSCAAKSGSDDKGSYDELTLRQGDDGEVAVRYYAARDAFVFHRRPQTLNLVHQWSVVVTVVVVPLAATPSTAADGGLYCTADDPFSCADHLFDQ